MAMNQHKSTDFPSSAVPLSQEQVTNSNTHFRGFIKGIFMEDNHIHSGAASAQILAMVVV